MKREAGVILAKKLKASLVAEGLPVKQVILFGSVAKGTAKDSSDIDIAVVCLPFAPTRHDENTRIRHIRRSLDTKIEPICLHAEDFQNTFSTIAREVERYGIAV